MWYSVCGMIVRKLAAVHSGTQHAGKPLSSVTQRNLAHRWHQVAGDVRVRRNLLAPRQPERFQTSSGLNRTCLDLISFCRVLNQISLSAPNVTWLSVHCSYCTFKLLIHQLQSAAWSLASVDTVIHSGLKWSALSLMHTGCTFHKKSDFTIVSCHMCKCRNE